MSSLETSDGRINESLDSESLLQENVNEIVDWKQVPSPPLVMVTSDYMRNILDELRADDSLWSTIQHSQFLTSSESETLRLLRKVSMKYIDHLPDTGSKDYAEVIFILLSKARLTSISKIVLLLTIDTLKTSSHLREQTIALSDPDPLDICINLMKPSDEKLMFLAALCATLLIAISSQPDTEKVNQFLTWIVAIFDQYQTNQQETAVQMCNGILTNPSVRRTFWTYERLIPLLQKLCEREGNQQLLYYLLNCFWLLSFDKKVSAKFESEHGVVSMLVHIARRDIKEKNLRLIFATCRNLLDQYDDRALIELFSLQFFPLCEVLSRRKWSDENLAEDVKYIDERLRMKINSMSNFEAYMSELSSGHLYWSPPHKSRDFWRDNAERFESDNLKALRLLGHILSSSSDPEVLSVVTHDIASYLKYRSEGRSYCMKLGIKESIMRLMTHSNAKVRMHALSALRSFMIRAWYIYD